MTNETHAIAGGGCHIMSGCGFHAPSYPFSFSYNPIFSVGSFHFTKPMLLAIISAGIVIGFFWAAFAKPKIVPSGSTHLLGRIRDVVQNLAELGVFFIRDQILRPMMGKRGDGYLPFLVSLFFFVWVMNLMEIIPVAQFPVTSRIAYPASLMLMVYITYTVVGIKHQGLGGYFKSMVPPGAPVGILFILAPLEVLQYVLIRPFTLAVRLFGNMFAGHILILVFTLASWYLFSLSIDLLFSATTFLMVIVLTAFEMFIQGLQAFIFTILTAQYIGGSLETAH